VYQTGGEKWEDQERDEDYGQAGRLNGATGYRE
jgi:hypothetical protein